MPDVGMRGLPLEARVQRLFFALGMHAERGLPIRVGQKIVSTATDIDVLAVSYGPNFHRSVFHAECKGGSTARAFDRIFWLAGVRRLLAADRSLLVIPTHNLAMSEFARTLDVETLHLATVRALERSYQVPRDWWPARSDVARWDPLLKTWSAYTTLPGLDEHLSATLKALYTLTQEEGWRVFSYTVLGRLLRLLADVGIQATGAEIRQEALHAVRLAVSCALVRLAHLVLGVCRDLAGRQPAERVERLANRLVFGDYEPETVRTLFEHWSALSGAASGLAGAPGTDGRAGALAPPPYQSALLQLVERLLRQPDQAIYLPYAVEMIQFGLPERQAAGAIEGWVEAGRPAVDQLKRFLAQGLGVQPTFLSQPSTHVLDGLLAPRRLPTGPLTGEVAVADV